MILAGGGSGNSDYLLPAARKKLEETDCILASPRFAALFPGQEVQPMGKISQLLEQLPERLERERIGIVVSGDPLLYSLCRTIQNRFPELELEIVPGVGSLQLLGAAFVLTMEQDAVFSMHGRDCTAGSLAGQAAQHPLTFFFCSAKNGPAELAAAMETYHLSHVTMYVGADLTSPSQMLWQGTPAQWGDRENPSLCVAAIRNPSPGILPGNGLLPDSAFLRNQSPMTKEEIRAVILSKLRLRPDSIVWDIGAGTGSVSVACARFCPFGQVYALEYKAAALEILEQNKALLGAENLTVVPGRAEEQMAALLIPDCVFIGGSGGAMETILQQLHRIPKRIRLVISAVTLETQALLSACLKGMPGLEIIQLTVHYGKTIGSYHVLDGGHPVLLFCCETEGQETKCVQEHFMQ